MWIEILLFFVFLFFLFYRFMTKDYHYFDGQGIPVVKPSFPFGCAAVKDMCLGKVTFLDIGKTIVEQYPDAPIIGFFMFQTPRYMINDENLARHILIKDFDHFVDRPVFKNGNDINNLFLTNLEGAEWKKMRALMSSVFTSGKLKNMFPHLKLAGENFGKYIAKVAEEGKEIDCKDTSGMFSVDGIATAGFGVDIDTFKEPDNPFYTMAMRITSQEGYTKQNFAWQMVKLLICKAFPWLGIDILKLDFFDTEALDFFANVVKTSYKHRLETGSRRNDVIDVLLDELKRSKKGEATKEGVEVGDEFEKNAAINTSDIKIEYKDEEKVLISNGVLFFFAGFDTTASVLGLVCHRLCMNPEAQDAVHEEIMEVIGEDGEVTFDKINQLKLMDKLINESLRVSNLIPELERICTKAYPVPGTDIVMPKDSSVQVHTIRVMSDNNNFYNAKEFDMENFSPDNNPNKFAYQGFGQGPRNCVGMRYAMLVMKIGLVYMLREHKIFRGSTMQDELRLNSSLNHYEGRLPATFQKRQQA